MLFYSLNVILIIHCEVVLYLFEYFFYFIFSICIYAFQHHSQEATDENVT